MAQFDVLRLKGGDALVVDCQSDLLDALDSRLVLPLFPEEAFVPLRLPRLNPVFEIGERSMVLVGQAAASIHVSQLEPAGHSLAEHRYIITNALDLLISGF